MWTVMPINYQILMATLLLVIITVEENKLLYWTRVSRQLQGLLNFIYFLTYIPSSSSSSYPLGASTPPPPLCRLSTGGRLGRLGARRQRHRTALWPSLSTLSCRWLARLGLRGNGHWLALSTCGLFSMLASRRVRWPRPLTWWPPRSVGWSDLRAYSPLSPGLSTTITWNLWKQIHTHFQCFHVQKQRKSIYLHFI